MANLYNIKDGKYRARDISIKEIYEYDVDTDETLLDSYCKEADFVFHLAGVNRPKEQSEFMEGNFGFTSTLLDTLKKYNNTCPVMISSSIQATLIGKYGESDYGKSKLAGEELLHSYKEETGAKVLVYRFPNLFGKWCRPNYNSAVADENGAYCYVPMTHKVTLGEIVDLLQQFKEQPQTLVIPEIPKNSFAKKLYSTYLSYLPKEKVSFPLKMNVDARGSFTELLKTADCGQFSINISKPGITKGEHWHNTKWEFFIVVAGHGLIQQRKIGSKEVMEFEVSGEKIEAVHMLPGYTHNIINLSDTENLVTVMWANEHLDPVRPDTYFERREVMQMETYETLSLLFLGGSFLLALLTYIDSRNNKRK